MERSALVNFLTFLPPSGNEENDKRDKVQHCDCGNKLYLENRESGRGKFHGVVIEDLCFATFCLA